VSASAALPDPGGAAELHDYLVCRIRIAPRPATIRDCRTNRRLKLSWPASASSPPCRHLPLDLMKTERDRITQWMAALNAGPFNMAALCKASQRSTMLSASGPWPQPTYPSSGEFVRCETPNHVRAHPVRSDEPADGNYHELPRCPSDVRPDSAGGRIRPPSRRSVYRVKGPNWQRVWEPSFADLVPRRANSSNPTAQRR